MTKFDFLDPLEDIIVEQLSVLDERYARDMFKEMQETLSSMIENEDETRYIVLSDDDHVNVDKYGFLELYCTKPTCDCRRVLFYVIKNETDHVATISYGFDPSAMQGPFLDPLHRQSGESEEILSMTKELLLNEQAYLDRLVRHYNMVKEATGGTIRTKEGKLRVWQQAKEKQLARKKQRQQRNR